MEQSKVDDNLVVNIPKPIEWVIPDSIRTDHATHLVVQQQGTEFILFFFEADTILYKEKLAQAFAYYYMRVALPIDIPKFEKGRVLLQA